MSKPYTTTDARDLIARIRFSTAQTQIRVGNVYYAFSLSISGRAVGDGAERPVTLATTYYGLPKSAPWTPAEVAQALTAAGTLKADLCTLLADWYIEALNEDIT